MELLTIAEFLHLTRLTDSELVTMLANGELTITSSPTQELLIDMSDLSPEQLAQRASERKSTVSPEDLPLLEEAIASEIVVAMEEIVQDAFQLARTWHAKPRAFPGT